MVSWSKYVYKLIKNNFFYWLVLPSDGAKYSSWRTYCSKTINSDLNNNVSDYNKLLDYKYIIYEKIIQYKKYITYNPIYHVLPNVYYNNSSRL